MKEGKSMGKYDSIVKEIENAEDLKRKQQLIIEKVFNDTVKKNFEEIYKATEKYATQRGYTLRRKTNVLRFVNERGDMHHCLLIDWHEVKLIQDCIPANQVVKSYEIPKYSRKNEIKEIIEKGLEAFVKYTVINKCYTTMSID